jgi:hypothetical protein
MVWPVLRLTLDTHASLAAACEQNLAIVSYCNRVGFDAEMLDGLHINRSCSLQIVSRGVRLHA